MFVRQTLVLKLLCILDAPSSIKILLICKIEYRPSQLSTAVRGLFEYAAVTTDSCSHSLGRGRNLPHVVGGSRPLRECLLHALFTTYCHFLALTLSQMLHNDWPLVIQASDTLERWPVSAAECCEITSTIATPKRSTDGEDQTHSRLSPWQK